MKAYYCWTIALVVFKKTLGDRAFSNAAPKIYNSLPVSIRSEENFKTFKKVPILKTRDFREAFSNITKSTYIDIQ